MKTLFFLFLLIPLGASAYTPFSAGQVLTAAQLNAAFGEAFADITGLTSTTNTLTTSVVNITSGLPTGTIVGTTDTQTLTNKTMVPRVASTTSSATITPSSADIYEVTALAVTASVAAPSFTPVDGQRLMLRIKDNGTAQTLSWTTTSGAYRAVGVTLPTTTVLSKVLYVGCFWNAQDSFWDVVAVAQQ